METQTRMEHDRIRLAPAPRLRGRRVVLAEDDRDFRRLVAAELRALGYQVTEARTGSELLECVGDALLSGDEAARPDVIISDVRMAELTGLEVLKRLRDARWKTAMVVMTAYADPATCAGVKLLQPDAFFRKPFDIDDLLTVVLNMQLGWRGGSWD